MVTVAKATAKFYLWACVEGGRQVVRRSKSWLPEQVNVTDVINREKRAADV